MDQLITVTRGDDIFLGIGTGISPKTLRARTLVTLPRSAGMLVTVEGAAKWPITGITEHNQEIYLLGPHIEGITLGEALEEDSAVLSILSRLARAVDLLERGSDLRPRLHPRTVIMEQDGGVLFLPDGFEHLVAESTGDALFENDEHLQSLAWKARTSLRFGIMAYYGLTGMLPTSPEPGVPLSRALAGSIVHPPILVVPDLREDVSRDVVSSLSTAPGRIRSAGEWEEIFSRWLRTGTHVDEGSRLPDIRRAAYQRSYALRRKRFRRQQFFRDRWKQLVAVALIATLAVTVPGAIAMRTLGPLETAGLGPVEVVEGHFAAINRLDTEFLQDTVAPRVDSGRMQAIDHIFVLSRIRGAIEGRPPVLPPDQWIASGRATLPPGTTLFGVSDLEVAELSETEGRPSVEVSYRFWQPASSEGEGEEDRSYFGVVYDIDDLLFLERYRDSWRIVERRTLSRSGRRIRIPYSGGSGD
jgi:hypothetical protein